MVVKIVRHAFTVVLAAFLMATTETSAQAQSEIETPMLSRRGFLACTTALGAITAFGGLELGALDPDRPKWNPDAKKIEVNSKALKAIGAVISILPGTAVNLTVAKLADYVSELVDEADGNEQIERSGKGKITYTDTAIKTSLMTLGSVMVMVFMPVELGTALEHKDLERLMRNPARMTFMTAVYAPIIEEAMFRLVPASLFGKRWSIGLISSLVFAGAHNIGDNGLELSKIPASQFLGGVLYWYFMKERGLDHAVFAHAANNNILAVASFLAQRFH